MTTSAIKMVTEVKTNMDKNLLIAELKRSEEQNKHTLRHLLLLSSLIGLDFTSLAVYKDYFKVFNMFVFGMCFIANFGQFGFIWYHRNEKLTVFSVAICVVMQCFSGMTALGTILLMQSSFEKILKTSQTAEILKTVEIFNWELKTKTQILSKTSDIIAASRRNIQIQVGLLLSSVMFVSCYYCFEPLLVNAYLLRTATNENTVILETPLPFMFILYEPAWIVQYILTIMQVYVAGMVAACFDSIFLVGTVHATALIKILRLLISNVGQVPKERRVEYLCCCSRFYQKIYSFFRDIDKIYSIPALIKYCFTLVITVMILFIASIGLEEDINMFIKMAFNLGAVACAIVVFLFNGQNLTTESEELPLTWYECEWYDESPEFKNIVRMMIMRTNRIMHYSLAGFATMSLVSLMFLIRTSGSYFLILKNFN